MSTNAPTQPDSSGASTGSAWPHPWPAPGDPSAGKPWPPSDFVDGETEHLCQAVDNGWCWKFPGWQWVADQVNGYWGGTRTAAACRAKYDRLQQQNAELSGGDRERGNKS